ncbi:hypothetical protein BHYA_0061g00200 [Botrytis hyacinthi]|uniref:Uncharacterized protein n=1 Tax=Botrytis hyacinthi TaxID=278943 RepID=A0A4Z1GQQ5_9HELO|nr:hypothetical protein BHYA_0061g00200 [Botrytis hyacinthi]
MPYKLTGTWQSADYAPDKALLLTIYQQRRNLGRWLSSRTPEDKERYRLEKKQEDRESAELDDSRREREMNRENRVRSRKSAREKIERKRGTPWDRERQDLDEAIRNWIREEETYMKLEQEAERKANEKERTGRKQARITKFEAMVKAEADRWTEELDLANAPRVYPYDDNSEGRLSLVHRYGCMPRTYTSTSRDQLCADCMEDEDMARQERQEMERRRNQWKA